MGTRGYTERRIFRLSIVSFLFLAVFLPETASASSVLDIAKLIKTLPQSTQTTLCSADAADCSTFLSNPTLATFDNLNSATLSSFFNNPTVSTLVPTLDANILPTLSTGTLSGTISNLTTPVLQSFQPQAFSLVSNGTLSSMLGNISPAILGNLGGSLLTGQSAGNLTAILSSPSLTGILPALPSALFGQLSSPQLSGFISNVLNDPSLTGLLGTTGLSGNLLTGIVDPTILSGVVAALGPNLIPLLPGTLFANIATGNLTTMFANLAPNLLAAFTSTFFSSFSTDTMTGLLSDLSSAVINMLGGDLLSSFGVDQLASIFSSISPEILGTFSSILTSGFSADTIVGLLSGALSSDIITSLGGSLLGGLTSGTLTSVFNALGAGGVTNILGPVAGTIFSGISSPVLSAALSGVTGGLTGPIGSAVTGMLPSSISSATGLTGGIGLFVPVNDMMLNMAFGSYVSKFTAYASDMKSALTGAPDSIRNIIAGGNPGGVANEPCHTRDANDKVWAYSVGPWASAVASSSGQLPATIPAGGTPGNPGPGYVKIIGQGQGGEAGVGNDSGSVRCVLTALVGYQKISLYVQIQGLLKQYVADAQQQQLSNLLLNQINSANLKWGKQGEQVNDGGVQVTESVYPQDTTQSAFNENGRTVETIVAQAAAPVGDPVGSLELCNPLETATAVAINTRIDTEDPRGFVTDTTRCSLTTSGAFSSGDSNSDLADYMDNPNLDRGLGAVDMLLYTMNNDQDMPLTSLTRVQVETDRRIAQQKERRDKGEANSGFVPTKVCSGLPDDPYCDPAYMTDVSPAAQNQEVITSALASGNQQIADSKSLDANESPAGERLSAEANTQPSGVIGYDTTQLASQRPPVNKLIQELYDTIQYAYFDLNNDQEQWASAALLSIYDTMKFDQSGPTSAIPTNQQENPSGTQTTDWQ